MKRLLAMTMVALIAISLVPASRAASPAPEVLREIDVLLDVIGTSGCDFYRNGTWYDARQAQAHVSAKTAWLLKRGLITTTEDFIVRAATKSSLSGEPYRIRCSDSGEVPADRWLYDQLARFRSLNRRSGAKPGPNEVPKKAERAQTGRS